MKTIFIISLSVALIGCTSLNTRGHDDYPGSQINSATAAFADYATTLAVKRIIHVIGHNSNRRDCNSRSVACSKGFSARIDIPLIIALGAALVVGSKELYDELNPDDDPHPTPTPFIIHQDPLPGTPIPDTGRN